VILAATPGGFQIAFIGKVIAFTLLARHLGTDGIHISHHFAMLPTSESHSKSAVAG